MSMKTLSRYDEMEIVDVLKNYLRLDKKRKRIDGIQSNRWFADDNSMQGAEKEGDDLDSFVENIRTKEMF